MPTDPSIRARLGPQLPYLRRYARALAGSQASGDHFGRAALEAMVEEEMEPAVDQDPKLLLFRMFHRFWNPHRNSVQDGHWAIAGLRPFGREALLLTAVEEFSAEDTGHILGCSAVQVAEAVTEAEEAIAQAIRSNVLIIEDEPLIAMHLEQLVTDMGHSIIGNATTRSGAVVMAQRFPPDLVLADIQLADGSSGLEAVRDILAMFDVPVVFVTAYPERLLTGAAPEPTYLVSKPFAPKAVLATIGQALLQRESSLSPTPFPAVPPA